MNMKIDWEIVCWVVIAGLFIGALAKIAYDSEFAPMKECYYGNNKVFDAHTCQEFIEYDMNFTDGANNTDSYTVRGWLVLWREK
jgi:hypothetical protein